VKRKFAGRIDFELRCTWWF